MGQKYKKYKIKMHKTFKSKNQFIKVIIKIFMKSEEMIRIIFNFVYYIHLFNNIKIKIILYNLNWFFIID